MDYRIILERTNNVRRQMRMTHQVMLSNEVEADSTDADMKAFDKKLNNISNAIHKIVGFQKTPQRYEKPDSIPKNLKVDKDFIISDLTLTKNELSKLQDELKEEKYRVVDKSINKVKALPNATRALFTKAVTDIEEMIASL